MAGTETERVESYTRVTLLSGVLAFPLFAFAVLALLPDYSPWPPVAWAYLAAVVAAATLAVVTMNATLRAQLGAQPPGAPLIAALLATSAAAAAIAIFLPAGDLLTGRVGAVCVALAIPVAGLAEQLRSLGAIVLASVAVGAAGSLTLLISSDLSDARWDAARILIVASFATGAIAVSTRLSVWLLRVVRELDRTREAHAQLAIAEERLRIARDLHDVVGRALTTIGVKSELATHLVRRGHDGAGDQVGEVRDLAHEAAREVRAVVAGYRSADLVSELRGASSLLSSAGARTRISGEDLATDLPESAQVAMGWALRESVTNVVRHSSATECTITLNSEPNAEVVLTVTNDGARPAAEPGSDAAAAGAAGAAGGSGLIGLRERLTAAGGGLRTGQDGALFTVTAWVPSGPGTRNAPGTRDALGNPGGATAPTRDRPQHRPSPTDPQEPT